MDRGGDGGTSRHFCGKTEGLLVGQLYDYAQRVQQHIERNGLDVFKTRGALAMRCGFIITLIEPDEPDDPQKLNALRSASREVLGASFD